jgi:hypothetical protein
LRWGYRLLFFDIDNTRPILASSFVSLSSFCYSFLGPRGGHYKPGSFYSTGQLPLLSFLPRR